MKNLRSALIIGSFCFATACGSSVDPNVDGDSGSVSGSSVSSGGAGGEGGSGMPVLRVTVADADALTVAANEEMVVMASFRLEAEGGDIPLTSIRFTRSGIGDPKDIESVRISGDSLPLSASPVKTIDPVTQTVTFDLGFTLPADVFTVVQPVCNFNASMVAGQHAMGISTAADLVVDSAEILGDFPLVGPIMTVGTAQ